MEIVGTTEGLEAPISEENEVVEEIKKEETPSPEPPKSGGSLFDQLQNDVEEPEEIPQGESVEDVLGKSSDAYDEPTGFDDNFEGVDDEELEGLFEDHKLMADIGVELIDFAVVYGCMALAGEKTEDKFNVPAARKNRIKKPLALLLRNKEAKVKPEVMVLMIILVTYAPVIYKAVKMKAEKTRKKKEAIEKKGTKKNAPHISENSNQNNLDRIKFQNSTGVEEKDPKNEGPAVDSDTKKIMAYKLKKEGKTQKEIAKELGIGYSTAYKYVKEGKELVEGK